MKTLRILAEVAVLAPIRIAIAGVLAVHDVAIAFRDLHRADRRGAFDAWGSR